MSEYRVHLDIFAGPLDLLLYLVRKEEVDIYDIPISRITDQYLQYVEMLKMFDIDLAGDFLVMAASLMEIKSAMLLPRAEVEEDGQEENLDPRRELVRQLLEYKRFKDAARMLGDSAEHRRQRHARPDTIISDLKQDREPEVDMENVSIWTLLEAFDAIMQATGGHADFGEIKDDTPIDLYQIEILDRLQREGPARFEDIFHGRDNRMVLVGLFLALLELIREQLVWAEQKESLGPVYLRALVTEPAEDAVQRAILIREEIEPEPETQIEDDAQTPSDAPHIGQKAPIPIVEIAPANSDIEKGAPAQTHYASNRQNQN